MQARVDNNALVVLLNGSVVMGSFISSNVTTSSCDNNTVDINKTSDTSLEVTFKSGIAVDINEKLGMLSELFTPSKHDNIEHLFTFSSQN